MKGRVSLESVQELPVIIEAIYEDRKEKEALLREMDRLCAPGAVFITNTSTLSVSRLADVMLTGGSEAATTGISTTGGVQEMAPVALINEKS